MKGVTVALLVSLGVNIALVSFMGGRLAGGAPPRPEPPGATHRLFERATPETRALLRQAFLERGEESRPLRREVGARRLDLRDAILAEPFDRARVEAAYKAFRAADGRMQEAHGAVVIDVLAKLPLEDRKALVEALAAPGRMGAARPHRRGGPAEPPPPQDPDN